MPNRLCSPNKNTSAAVEVRVADQKGGGRQRRRWGAGSLLAVLAECGIKDRTVLALLSQREPYHTRNTARAFMETEAQDLIAHDLPGYGYIYIAGTVPTAHGARCAPRRSWYQIEAFGPHTFPQSQDPAVKIATKAR